MYALHHHHRHYHRFHHNRLHKRTPSPIYASNARICPAKSLRAHSKYPLHTPLALPPWLPAADEPTASRASTPGNARCSSTVARNTPLVASAALSSSWRTALSLGRVERMARKRTASSSSRERVSIGSTGARRVSVSSERARMSESSSMPARIRSNRVGAEIDVGATSRIVYSASYADYDVSQSAIASLPSIS